jgi:hypothetical protein
MGVSTWMSVIGSSPNRFFIEELEATPLKHACEAAMRTRRKRRRTCRLMTVFSTTSLTRVFTTTTS